ncbi:MAG: phosphoribosyltransferase [Armatimonadetes bacterium]|nr:MAG: phosphoribosyltransferase [Armatimonadota bacterium]
MVFKNRQETGEKLAEKLEKYQGQDVVVYALPRGGVVLGAEIARKLHAPLDLIIVRKIGHPLNPEYALCATSENAHMVCNEEELAGVDQEWFKKEVEKERQEAKRRREAYLKGRKPVPAKGKIAIIIDDGVATGLTMFTAIIEIKHQKPKKVIVAVPVAPKETADQIESKVDEFVSLEIPEIFLGAIGAYYEYFPQVSDEEVINLFI